MTPCGQTRQCSQAIFNSAQCFMVLCVLAKVPFGLFNAKTLQVIVQHATEEKEQGFLLNYKKKVGEDWSHTYLYTLL